jgi:hypothetical protein
VLLRWLFNLLAVVIVWRLVRWAFRQRSAPPAGVRPRRGLDPDREVRASWSEVSDPKEGDGT